MEDFIKATDSLNEGRKKLNAIAKEMNEKDVASMPEIVNARAGEPSLRDRLDKEKNEVTAQLAQTESDKVDKNGSQQVKWANIAQDAREQISGDKVAVVGKDAVGTENISDNAITTDKLDNKSVGLFEAFNPSFIIGFHNSETGEYFSTNKTIATTDVHMVISDSDTITVKGQTTPDKRLTVMFYDKNKTYISRTNQNQGSADRTVLPPGNARYILMNFSYISGDNFDRELTRSELGELSSLVIVHRHILKKQDLMYQHKLYELEIELDMDVGTLAKERIVSQNQVVGQIIGTENTTIHDAFLENRRTGKYLTVLPNTEIALNYHDGSALLFEYDNDFESLGFVALSSGVPIKLTGRTKYIKIAIENLTVRNIRPKLNFLTTDSKAHWVYNLNIPNRTQGNITFIYEVFTNEGRDILNPDGTEKQYAEEQYFNTGILKLPPNYDPNGEPVKLIIFVQGSSGYNAFNSHSIALGYERGYSSNTFGYLLDEGYAIMSVYHWTNKYDVDGGTNYGSPITMTAYANGFNWVTKNYNVSKTGAFISGVSAGGSNAINLIYNKSIPSLAAGLLVPTVTPTRIAFGSSALQRKAYADDFGFEGDDSVLNEHETGSPAIKWGPEVEEYIRNNLKKTIGYNPRWNGIINEDLDVLIERGALRQESDYELNKNQKRICPIPVKAWIAKDDDRIYYDEVRLFVESIKNAQGNAELRTLPDGTGSHSAVGGSPETIVVDNITTRLGIEQTNVPLAVVELVQYFRRFEN